MQFAKIVIFISEKPVFYKNNNNGKSIKNLPLLLMFSVAIIISLLILRLPVSPVFPCKGTAEGECQVPPC